MPSSDSMRIGDRSWGWVEGQTYVSAHVLLSSLIDRVSRGGSLMLSISPKADGSIPEGQQKPLLAVGRWLSAYGEAIYTTRAWSVYAEGDEEKLIDRSGKHRRWTFEKFNAQDKRYTQSKDGQTVYVMTLGKPSDRVTFAALGLGSGHTSRPIQSVQLLGTDGEATWQQGEEGLFIDLGSVELPSELAAVWKISL